LQARATWPREPSCPAGGTTHVLARALAEKRQLALGQPVIAQSKPGAGATLGADCVAKAKPDGCAPLVGAVHHTIVSSVYKKLPYDFQNDLALTTEIALVPKVLVVNTNTPVRAVAELVTPSEGATRQAQCPRCRWPWMINLPRRFATASTGPLRTTAAAPSA
jgi:tripartite-type tricarboxylate transporter receptor subunit TctC